MQADVIHIYSVINFIKVICCPSHLNDIFILAKVMLLCKSNHQVNRLKSCILKILMFL